MTSLFKLFSQSCGLPLKEVQMYLGTKPDTTKSWWLGRRKAPEKVLVKLTDLAVKQDMAAQQLLLQLQKAAGRSKNQHITLKAYTSDCEVRELGWPLLNAYRAIIRKAVERLPSSLAIRLIVVTTKKDAT